LSIRLSGVAPQLCATSPARRRPLSAWIARATSSLPAPVSPCTSTGRSLAATRGRLSSSPRHPGDSPIRTRSAPLPPPPPPPTPYSPAPPAPPPPHPRSTPPPPSGRSGRASLPARPLLGHPPLDAALAGFDPPQIERRISGGARERAPRLTAFGGTDQHHSNS